MKSESATYTGFEFEVDGYPALAIINIDLKNVSKKRYSYSAVIQIIPDSFNEMGHPEGEEHDYLNEIEKTIIEYLEGQTQTVHIGHTTAYRSREIIFYTADKEAVENFLTYFLSNIERENRFEMEADAEWKNVSAFYELL